VAGDWKWRERTIMVCLLLAVVTQGHEDVGDHRMMQVEGREQVIGRHGPEDLVDLLGEVQLAARAATAPTSAARRRGSARPRPRPRARA
jgi:hypothetical protein